MTEIDRGIALTADGEGRYAGHIDPAWFVLTGPNGGYVAAMLARAATTHLGPNRPLRTLSTHYLQPAAAGPVTVTAEALRDGRSMSFVELRLTQDGRVIAVALAAAGTGRSEVTFQDLAPPPDIRSADDIDPPPDVPGMPRPPIADRLDYRPHRLLEPFTGADSEFWCWLRLRERRPVDAAVLTLYSDAMFPAVFMRLTTPAVAPTVDLTVHLRAAPRPGYDGWCLAHVVTRTVAEGFLEEDVEIYDEEGRLLAQSRQLGLLVPFG